MGEFDIGGNPNAGRGAAARTLPEAIRSEAEEIIATTIMVDSPEEVNGGYCRQLAEDVASRMAPELGPIRVVRAWQGMGSRHFFIEHGGRYYDAERPDGVDEIRQLPFFGGGEPHDIEVVAAH